ncbi:MAG: hypothetical protein ACLPJJ_04095 [Acidocella sp.]|uniref:hypothetical protein n=1 Tax=Acidocella sp. TaxID=50710 RepID=UPI003FC469CB
MIRTVRRTLGGAALSALALAAAAPAAHAHAVAGARVFVNTLLIDDPGVGDEANLPLASVTSPDGKSTVTDLNFEYDKTIFDNLALGVGTDYDWITNDAADNKKSHGGLDDPYVQLKYRWIVLPEHEFISSVAVQQSFGRAGTTTIDSGYDTTTFSGYFGKGFGDIPFAPIRPFALTGELDYNVPNTGQSTGYGSVNTWSGGLTLQYSIPYLQSQIKDYGLPPLLGNLTPLVELGWSSAAGSSAFRPTNNPTTFNLGTGAVWTGQYYSFSTELLWPLNSAAGHGLGVIGQFHLYFDDLFPDTLGKPLFGS